MATAAVASAIVVCVVPTILIRAVTTVPLCLVLPGYALTRAIFARRDYDEGPTRTMQITLAIALSVTTLIIGALGLDLLPGGLQRTSWAVLLACVTVLASAVSGVRRGQAGAATATSGPVATEMVSAESVAPRSRPSLGSTVMVALASAIAVAALVVSRLPLPAQNAIGYTQLWILPSAHGKRAVEIGVACDQLHATGYRLVVAHGRRSTSLRITLQPGRTQTLLVPVHGRASGWVRATLYRDGRSKPYREVRLATRKV